SPDRKCRSVTCRCGTTKGRDMSHSRFQSNVPAFQAANHITCASSLSWNRSVDRRTTIFLLVFFHQCDVPLTSAVASPALCTIGALQVLRYSVIWPVMM